MKRQKLERRVSIIGTACRQDDAGRFSQAVFDKMKACAKTIIRKTFGLQLESDAVTLVSGGAAGADHVAVELYQEIKACYPLSNLQLLLFLPARLHLISAISAIPAIPATPDVLTNAIATTPTDLLLLCKEIKLQAVTSQVVAADILTKDDADGKCESSSEKPIETGYIELKNGSKRDTGDTANRLHKTFARILGRKPTATLDQLSHLSQDASATLDMNNLGFFTRNSRVAESQFLIAFTWHDKMLDTRIAGSGTSDTWVKCKKGRKIHVPLRNLMAGTFLEPKISTISTLFKTR